MVNRETYERYQLELIAAEYESKGFRILQEYQFPNSEIRVDAIALNPDNREAILIEIVNAHQRQDRHLQHRAEKIRELIKKGFDIYDFPPFDGFSYFMRFGDFRWSVDFRYIDSMEHAEFDRNNLVQSTFSGENLKDIIDRKLPASQIKSRNTLILNRQFLSDWWGLAQIIRGFIKYSLKEPAIKSENSVLEHYNTMISKFDIVPAEQLHEVEIPDLFQLYESVQKVINGSQVEIAEVSALRMHLVNLRKQVKLKLKQLKNHS